MQRKIFSSLFTIIFCLFLLLMTTSCNNNEYIDVVTGGITTFDNVGITIYDNYKFVDFDKEYKDNKCIVTINYIEEVADD